MNDIEYYTQVKETVDQLLLINADVIEQDDKTALEALLKETEHKLMILVNRPETVSSTKQYGVEIVAEYCEASDKTFVSRVVYDCTNATDWTDWLLVSQEVTGWYYGEPNDEDTLAYSEGSLKATYNNK